MADKVLKSIKFPQLPDKYVIPEVAPEYNPESNYHYFNAVTYNGEVYVCNYIPETADDPEYVTGPFNPNYWISGADFEFLLEEIYDIGVDLFWPGYDYVVGDVVRFINRWGTYVCYRNTPSPAGIPDFHIYDYFQGLADDTSAESQISMVAADSLNRITELEAKISWDERNIEELDFNYEWTKQGVVYDPDTGDEIGFESAICTLKLEKSYDYFLHWDVWHDYDLLFEYFEEPFDDPTDIQFQYSLPRSIRIPGNNYLYLKIVPKVWHLNDDDEVVYNLLTDEDIESAESNIYLGRMKLNSGDIDTTQVNKLLLQDYTEVYKSLKQSCTSLPDPLVNDYIDSYEIPLQEGNIALQFINLDNSWENIHIQVRFYRAGIGNMESIDLKESDKYLYIVTENSSNTNQLTDYDYFKLRFTYLDGSSPDSSMVSFINSNLNILRKPKTQSSPNPIRRNDESAVQEFINVARSYMKGSYCYSIQQPTFIENEDGVSYRDREYDNFSLDVQTFIGLCLRGLNFDNTPYSANWTIPDDYIQVRGGAG